MARFNVTVREHSYTGRFYSDVVQAESCEDALQVASEQDAGPQPSPGSPLPRGFSVVVREQAYAGRFYSDVVQAESCGEALEAAAARADAPQPSLDPRLQADAAGRPRCADVWVYSVLHCELAAGHDAPHMAVARGYGRPVSWVRDDRGLAHALPDPATGTPMASSNWTRDAGIAAGDGVIAELAPEGPQRADLAEDIAAALAASPAAAAFFGTLAQYDRKGYLRWIDATTHRPDLRAARIAEVVDLLAAGITQRRRL